MHQRLHDLLAHQGLPAEPGQDLIRLLEPVHPLEYSVHSHRIGVGAMVNGDGPEHCQRVLRVMAHFGLGDLKGAIRWIERFGGRRVFLKVDFGPQGAKELSLYFRRRPPVESVLQWLNQDGVDRESLLAIAHAAQYLSCPKAHFVAQSWELERGEVERKVYFTQPPGRLGWVRTVAWLGTRGVPQDTLTQLQSLELEDAQRFVSLRIGAQGVKPGAKMDIAEPSPALTGLLSTTDAVGEARVLSLMQSGPVDYLGWDVSEGAQGVGLYSTRR